MIRLLVAPTLDDALHYLTSLSSETRTVVFCEDRLTLLAERAVLQDCGGTFLTEVTTFRRYLEREKNVVSKQGSVMAVAAILAAHESELHCFKKGHAQAVYETLAQLSASRIGADELRESAAETEGLLSEKLKDLAFLLEQYQAFLESEGLLDENGYLALLPEKIERGLKGADALFFAFPSFTAQAREGLRAAMQTANSVTGVFLGGKAELYTNEGWKQFREIAAEFGGCECYSIGCSLEGDALRLRDILFDPETFRGEKKPSKRIFVSEFEDDAEEFSAVCALIKKYASAGVRYRDMTVLVASDGSFSVAEKAFRAHKIPFFADRKRPFSQHPFCRFVLDCLSAVADGCLPDSADAVASSYYFGNADEFRNYLLKYGAYRGGALKPVKEGEAVKRYDRAALVSCRDKMEAVLRLFPAKGSGKEYVSAVRKLSELTNAEERTQELQEKLSGAERAFLNITPLAGVLDETEALTGGQIFTAREFYTLFKNGLSALNISLIPQGLDGVFVGDVTESRFARSRVLFVTGLTEEVPRALQDAAVISDREIKRLSALSLEIEPAVEAVNARARESVALNLCAFGQALYLSRPLAKGDAETAKSEVLSYVERAFKTSPCGDLFPYNCTEFSPAVLELLSLKQNFERGRDEEDNKKYSALYLALARKKGEGAMEALLGKTEKKITPRAGELFFLREPSPTLLEDYFKCPYSDFLLRGLKVREREERAVLDVDAGSFVHGVLEACAERFNLFYDEEACRAYAEQTGKELLLSPRYAALTDTAAGVYTGKRLVGEGVAAAIAAYRQIKGSSFRVSGAEKTVTLPALGMSGKADRVDEAEGYVRVVDYKTGEIDDSVLSYYTGRKLQLQLYLLAVSEGKKPAGAFYFPAADEFGKAGEERFRMSGFFSKEDAVLALMDGGRKEGEKSAFFEGGGRTEKGMPQEDFEDFLTYSLLVARGAEEEMRAGCIEPSPYEGACEYCKCKGACGFTGAPRKERAVSAKEVVAIVRGEDGR